MRTTRKCVLGYIDFVHFKFITVQDDHTVSDMQSIAKVATDLTLTALMTPSTT